MKKNKEYNAYNAHFAGNTWIPMQLCNKQKKTDRISIVSIQSDPASWMYTGIRQHRAPVRGSGSQLEQKTHANTSYSRVPRRNILGFACFARVFWFVSFSNLHLDFSETCVAGSLGSSWWDFWADSKSSILGSFLDQIGFRSLWIR